MAKIYCHINQCDACAQYLANIHRDRRQYWLLLYEAVGLLLALVLLICLVLLTVTWICRVYSFVL